jgi:hypothetical protein
VLNQLSANLWIDNTLCITNITILMQGSQGCAESALLFLRDPDLTQQIFLPITMQRVNRPGFPASKYVTICILRQYSTVFSSREIEAADAHIRGARKMTIFVGQGIRRHSGSTPE